MTALSPGKKTETMVDFQVDTRRCFDFGELLPFDEGLRCEFKAHRNLSVEELPPWCFVPGYHKNRRSRRAISRTICGFLNTGHGGKIFMGVTDMGYAKGIHLSLPQADHIRVALQDLLERFVPRVSFDMIKIRLIPVLLDESFAEWQEKIRQSRWWFAKRRQCPHLLRTYQYCWCDIDAQCQHNIDIWLPAFLIELTVLPGSKPVPQVIVPAEKNWPEFTPIERPNFPMFYQDEEGRCYIRGAAGLSEHQAKDIIEITEQDVISHYQPIVDRMREALHKYTAMLEC